ncbi:metallophosphoesterase [Flavobacterium procerum]|uniref:Metallophosphoesterase n=1 Tax=Flavobacterium procerum TaxID=1455569 RepID=A0ABV6BMY5_9FLAO
MIRILHLTDFHLDTRTLKDWNNFYKDALLEKLKELNEIRPIDFIVFTGDLIDKGGKDFKGATKGFEEFKINVILPILELLQLEISRFIITPGNHDINRFADGKIDENGLKSTLTNAQEVIDFMDKAEKSGTYRHIERIKEYKNFEFSLYESVADEKLHSLFQFSLRFKNIAGKSVGISSLNSSWRCYDDNDFGNLFIGENQVNNNFKFIKDCHLKIAIVHHQLDWLSQVEKQTIHSHINKNFDIVFSGHVHEHMSSMHTGFTGSCFHNVSPSGLNQIRSDKTLFQNGFTLVDYNDSITCHYLKYNHAQQKFVDNTDVVEKGIKKFLRPQTESEDELTIYRDAIENIKEDHYSDMDLHFIKGKNQDVQLSVKTAFIFPPIDNGKSFYDENQTNTNFNDILNSHENMIFLGPQEIGKTSLLYRLVVEFVDEFDIYTLVPVFIDFNEIKNKEFITLIKEYTRLSTDKVKILLEKGKFVLLLDNLNCHESKNLGVQINRLNVFHSDYPKNRIITSYTHDNLEMLPTEIFTHCKIPFSYQYIRGMKTKEIKQIMTQWLPSDDVLKNEENLEKLVNTFSSYHLPNNALSVHLYLWSLESHTKPINQAVLMEIYIELILEKLSTDNIYRSSFDFKNKVQLISMIAEKIIEKEDNTYYLSYTEFYKTIEDYLKNKVGFNFDVNIVINYLFERKIFTKNNANEVKFSHVCFRHFFTARRMQDNPMFKEFILDECRYFNYPKEIDYYTGLVRSDRETFITIYERFKKLFDPMNFILKNLSPDDYFDIKIEKGGQKISDEPIARNIEIAKIKDSRPTDEQIEKQYDEQLDKISNQKQEVKGKKHIDFDRMMLIMCNVLRNSEGLEDLDLKKRAYRDIIKHNLTYSILYTQVVIRYIQENEKLPPSISQNVSLESILKNMPYHIQYSIYTHLGTQKLGTVILEKIISDGIKYSKDCTEIEKFLSIALYSDIQGENFNVYLRKFVKSASTVPTQNYLLFKLTDYLHRRSKPDSPNEELYLDLISDLKIRTQKLPKRMKDTIIKDLKEKKNQFTKFLLD